MSKRTEVIIVRETLFQSVTSDVVSIGGLIAAIGLGVWLQSPALQWIGGLMFFIALCGKAATRGRLTIAQARKALEEIEREADA